MSASDDPVREGTDEQEPLEELFGNTFDLAEKVASRISSDEIEARLRLTLQQAGRAGSPAAAPRHPRVRQKARHQPGSPAPASPRPAATHKAAVYLGLVEDDHAYYNQYDDSYGAEEYGEYGGEFIGQADSRDAMPHTERSLKPPDRPPEREPAVQMQGADLATITTLHPRTYNDARIIGEHLRKGTPVIINLTETADSDARRLVDFAAGLIFGLRGRMDRVTNKVFLLSPAKQR